MRALADLGRRAGRWIERFVRAKDGNVAMMFGVTGIVLLGAGGAGLDWSRAMVTKTRLAAALDAAGLAIGTTNGLTTDQLQAMAQRYFDANYPPQTVGTPGPVQVSVDGQSLSLSVTAAVPTTLLKVMHIDSIALSVSNQIVRAVTKLRVALVLDITGSMNQSDSTGTTKIAALKTATHQLLTQLQNAAINPGDVRVALVPFSLDVNVGTANVSATWIGWTDWEAPPPNSMPSSSVGPGSSCPYSNSDEGFRCRSNPTNTSCNIGGSSSGCVSSIPSSGSYTGYVCPSANKIDASNGRGGHYYNGCYNSVKTNPSCSSSCTYTHTWIPNNHSTWTGCVMDRDQNYDTDNTTPSTGNAATLFPAENNAYCPPAATPVQGLSFDWTSLNNAVDTMTPNGSTNQTVGFAWGWQALTEGAPLNAPAADEETNHVIIILSDGLNTQNRWIGNGSSQNSQVDNRETIACANAKATGVIVYSVFVDLGGTSGNSAPLQNCASDPGKYFDLTTSGQIVTAFNQIGTELANLHLAQ